MNTFSETPDQERDSDSEPWDPVPVLAAVAAVVSCLAGLVFLAVILFGPHADTTPIDNTAGESVGHQQMGDPSAR